MAEIGARALRNETRKVLERVGQGEQITITVDGLAVAVLQPINARPRWVPRSLFISKVLRHQADPGLAADLKKLVPDTTDDMPL